ncbi:MAG: hypothetical protein E6G09_04535 [Actinobacteria bacterium]|nr:MAG: hypothetical protein E6G09_04535 [Actinomycetota bacterium]
MSTTICRSPPSASGSCETSLDELRNARAYANENYKPPKGGWPTADTLQQVPELADNQLGLF